jgi:glycerol kinase
MRHVISIDQGTTGTTVLVLDEQLAVRGRGYQEFPQIYPQPGWVEHEPDAIWASVTGALRTALAGVAPASIAAIGITNQRETTLLWDRATGIPVHRAIVWQDRRTPTAAPRCAPAASRPSCGSARASRSTRTSRAPRWRGCSTTSTARGRAARGELAFGTIDTWLVTSSPAAPTSPT